MKQQLQDRMKKLNWTLYQVAKRVSDSRAKRSHTEPSPATRYHTTIDKAIECPGRSRLETLEEIVGVLGGRLQIVWEDAPTIPAPTTTRAYSLKVFNDQGVLVSLVFYTSFNNAFEAMLTAAETGGHAEIHLDAECFCTSEQVKAACNALQSKEEPALSTSVGWVVIA